MRSASMAIAAVLLTACVSTAAGPSSTSSPAGGGYKYSAYGLSMWHPGGLMATETTGWSGGGLLSRTTDGGATWTKVLPSGLDSTFDILQSEYLDATHAWVIQHLPDQKQVVVYRTEDGGASWERGAPLPRQGADWPAQLDFVDPLNGWMLITEGASYQAPEDFRLYRTGDGGLQWRLQATSATASASTGGSFACNRWCLMSFASASRGAITSLDPVARAADLSVLVTRDGGASWTRRPIGPSGTPPRCPCYVDRPIFQAAEGGFLVVWSGSPPLSGRLLVSDDGGMTWTGRPLPGEAQFGMGFTGVGFSDARQGWAIAGPSALFASLDASPIRTVPLPLYRTRDGGHTWVRVETALALRSPNGRVAVYFPGGAVGFAVRTGSSGVQLLKSTDGGQSWEVVGDSLPGGPP